MKKFKKRKQKGITLIALIITIIIMLILVSVSIRITMQSGLFEKAGKAVQNWDTAQDAEGELAKGDYIDEIVGEYVNSIVADGSWDGTINTPKLGAGMTPIAWDESGNPFTPKTNAKWYDYENNKWANAVTEDGSYWVWIPRYEYKITAPTGEAEAGTIDVRFIGTDTKSGSTGYTTTNGITTSSDNYIIHPSFTNNAAVGGWNSELAGFWVAKYEMSMEGKTDSGEWTTLTPTATSSTTAISGNVGTTNTITAYNATASEKNKLSTSVTDGTNTYANIRAVSKPNVSSWRYINISNVYENACNYDRSKESHLMKNSEWGAIAYLTHSQYGRDGEEVSINACTGYYTGAGPLEAGSTATYSYNASTFATTYAYNTTLGKLASSTGNITGVYDLSGGAYEYVAAFNDAYSSSGDYYSTTNESYKSSIGTNMGAIGLANSGSTKYLTAYKNSKSYHYIGQDARYSSFTNFENAGMKVSITGDAIKEVWVSGSRAWLSNYSYFVYSSYPFFIRGGSCSASANAGVFYSNYTNGYTSFRVVCSL